jgi:DNA-binding cell septation regulator SpoVG
MQIAEITIHPINEDLGKAYVSIVFDNCFMDRKIRIIQGPTGFFVSFPFQQADGRRQRPASWLIPPMPRHE